MFLRVVLGLPLSLYAQDVTVTTVAVIPDYVQDDSAYAKLVAGPGGDFYGVLNGSYFFKIGPSGQYTRITTVTASDLVLGPDGDFYGSAFRLTPAGVLTLIHDFGSGSFGLGGNGAPTLGNDGYFYAMAARSGSNGGTFYRFSTSGAFQVLNTLNGDEGESVGAPLVQATDGDFYGVAETGGKPCAESSDGCGTIFRFTPNGEITILYSFAGKTDGGFPGSLTVGSDGNLYGVALVGGATSLDGGEGYGTIFKLELNGNFSVVHTFTGNDAAPVTALEPYLAEPNGELYGDPDDLAQESYPGTFGVAYTNGKINPLSASFAGPVIEGGYSSPFLAGADGSLYAVEGGFGDAGMTGGLIRESFDPPLAPPVQLTLVAAKVKPGAPVSASFSVNNAFSLTMQQCYGFQVLGGVVTPLGKAPGVYNSSTQLYTGAVTLPAPKVPGNYSYALTCGGVESGYAALQVGSETAVALSASSSAVTPPGTDMFTATVTSPDGKVGVGSVRFASEGEVLGTVAVNASGVAVLTASSAGVPAGTYPVTATYVGASPLIGSVSAPVSVVVK